MNGTCVSSKFRQDPSMYSWDTQAYINRKSKSKTLRQNENKYLKFDLVFAKINRFLCWWCTVYKVLSRSVNPLSRHRVPKSAEYLKHSKKCKPKVSLKFQVPSIDSCISRAKKVRIGRTHIHGHFFKHIFSLLTKSQHLIFIFNW